ncbi:MAG: hypothetical protein JSU86_13250 [Phycisphaerales bacterium]|nr:MAG: hypothetical protein JSU86_13250 [Phycisphaerales bacterium]
MTQQKAMPVRSTPIVMCVLSVLACFITSVRGATPSLDTANVPFSYRGSYLALTSRPLEQERKGGVVYVKDVSGKQAGNWLLRVEVIHERKAIAADVAATPERLALSTPAGNVHVCFENPSVLRIRGTEVGFRVQAVDDCTVMRRTSGQYRVLRGEHDRFMFTRIGGAMTLNLPEGAGEYGSYRIPLRIELTPDPDTRTCEIALEEYLTEWTPRSYTRSFDQCVAAAKAEFAGWVRKMPTVPSEYQEALELAAYVNWSCLVAPRGVIRREGMYMSKNWMNHVWSWDNCFNALATAYTDPDLAWDQIQLLFDFQDENGSMPDYVDDYNVLRGYVKPPVHGWAVRELMKVEGVVTGQRLVDAYEHLARWTDFWMKYRDDDGNGIPQYNHGYDSGWDNGTPFDVGFPHEGPDLCAFLVLQMDVLAEIALKLGKKDEAGQWKERSDVLLERMIERFWIDGRFVSKLSGTNKWNDRSRSLMSYLPIVLGKRLPLDIRTRLLRDLKSSGIMTEHGLATEHPDSGLYRSDGYWRGPVWAPTTWLIAHGVNRAGDREFAKEIARRFCKTCAKSGFAENFDALTGAPLEDPAHTWTASGFIFLAHEYLTDNER